MEAKLARLLTDFHWDRMDRLHGLDAVPANTAPQTKTARAS